MQEQIEAVQRMQDYIFNHLYDEITLHDLSKVALYSPWYARKIFTALTGITPSEYIRRLRLSKSALKLRDEKCHILDIAYEMGFNHVDSYTRAFHRVFGCNPKEYAQYPIPLQLFIPYGVKYQFKERKERKMGNTKNVFIQVVEKTRRKLILKRGKKATNYFEYGQEVGCDVWGILLSIKSISNEPVGMWLPKKYRKEKTSEYIQGVEVPLDYNGKIPDGFEIIELEKAKYLMFQGEPFAEENFEEAIQEIWEAKEKYDPSILNLTWDDENPRIQLEPIGTRGYIEFYPVK